jgi:hypothetical protein
MNGSFEESWRDLTTELSPHGFLMTKAAFSHGYVMRVAEIAACNSAGAAPWFPSRHSDFVIPSSFDIFIGGSQFAAEDSESLRPPRRAG